MKHQCALRQGKQTKARSPVAYLHLIPLLAVFFILTSVFGHIGHFQSQKSLNSRFMTARWKKIGYKGCDLVTSLWWLIFMMLLKKNAIGKEVGILLRENQEPKHKKRQRPEASPSWSEEKILKCVGSLHRWIFCLKEEKLRVNTPDSVVFQIHPSGLQRIHLQVLEREPGENRVGSSPSTWQLITHLIGYKALLKSH